MKGMFTALSAAILLIGCAIEPSEEGERTGQDSLVTASQADETESPSTRKKAQTRDEISGLRDITTADQSTPQLNGAVGPEPVPWHPKGDGENDTNSNSGK
jgi:hypothetical protein